MLHYYPWPITVAGWENEDDEETNTSSGTGNSSDEEVPNPILMERPNPGNQFYVDSRRRLCCDVRQMEEYYLEQERLYYIFHKPTDTIHRTFVLNMLGPVAEMMEAKFKGDAVTDLEMYSIAQLYQIATELIQGHSRLQELKKYMK